MTYTESIFSMCKLLLMQFWQMTKECVLPRSVDWFDENILKIPKTEWCQIQAIIVALRNSIVQIPWIHYVQSRYLLIRAHSKWNNFAHGNFENIRGKTVAWKWNAFNFILEIDSDHYCPFNYIQLYSHRLFHLYRIRFIMHRTARNQCKNQTE